MNKIASVLAVSGTLAFLGAGAAQAAPVSSLRYPVEETSVTVTDGTIAPGESVTFSSSFADDQASPFIAGEIVDLTVDRTDATPSAAGFGAGGAAAARGGLIVLNQVVLTDSTTADANGNFSFTVQLNEEGVYTLTARGRTSGATVSQTVVVDSANAIGGTTGTSGGSKSSVKGGLANTGIDSAMLLWGAAGIGALGLGAGSIVVARRSAVA
jgi:hypothetical protein